MGIALLLGLLMGIAGAIVLEKSDDRIRSLEDMESVTGLPTLGVIPKVDSGRNVETEIFDARSEVSEAYRSLCTSLHFATEHGLPKTLLITRPLQARVSQPARLRSRDTSQHWACESC